MTPLYVESDVYWSVPDRRGSIRELCKTNEVEMERKCVKHDDFEREKVIKTGEDEAGPYDFLILYYRILQVLYTVETMQG